MTTRMVPLGIRNNNPGNLRGSLIEGCEHAVIDGFVVFKSQEVGLANLFQLIHLYYEGHQWRTVWDFVSHYAPATENDVLAYARTIGRWLRIPEDALKTRDMQLGTLFRVFDLARAIILVENGVPPTVHPTWPEWFGVFDFTEAMELVPYHDDEINDHQATGATPST